MASNIPTPDTRVVSMPVADFDRAHGWVEAIITVVRDLEAESQSAIDAGDPLDSARIRDYLRLAASTLRSACLLMKDARIDSAADAADDTYFARLQEVAAGGPVDELAAAIIRDSLAKVWPPKGYRQ